MTSPSFVSHSGISPCSSNLLLTLTDFPDVVIR